MSLWTPYAEEALDLSKSPKDRESPEQQRLPMTPERPYVYPYDEAGLPVQEYSNSFVSKSSPDSARSAWSPYSRTSPSLHSPEIYELESLSDDVEYQAFERDALRAMAERNGGALLGNNPRMRRAVQASQTADDSYRKQRERNNYAAKQSRDRRKLREMRLAFQVTFLQKKLTALRARIGARYCARCQQKCQC